MKRMTLPAILAAVVLAFSLAGCSGAQTLNDDTLKGVWSLENSSDLGFEAYVSFEDDSVVEMMVADAWLSGTWSVSGTEATLTFEDAYEEELDEGGSESESASEDTAKATLSNNKLTIGSSNGSKLVFVRDDSEEAKSLFALDLDGQEGMDEGLEYVDEVIDPVDPAVVVADDDKFSISVTGKGTDYTGDPCYMLTITNKTDKDVYVIPEEEFTVGDKKVEAGLGEEVEAGATVEAEMYFAKDDLGGAAEMLTTVDGVVQVFDSETDDELGSYTFHME